MSFSSKFYDIKREPSIIALSSINFKFCTRSFNSLSFTKIVVLVLHLSGYYLQLQCSLLSALCLVENSSRFCSSGKVGEGTGRSFA